MKIWNLAPILFLAAGFAVVAQEDTDFIAGMKSVGTASDNLKKMEQKTGRQAVRSAERIAVVYENMIGYWRQRNASDAVKASTEGKAAALQLSTAAYAADNEKANAALTALGATCRSCHEAHREKIAEGKYRIK
jgi:hypothetical protein